jgi:hypothetical protein
VDIDKETGFETVACIVYPFFERGERPVSKRRQPVEKVVVGPVGSPKEVQTPKI